MVSEQQSDSVGPGPRWRRGYSLRRREAVWFYIFILPWIIGFLVFQFGPILAAAYFSFSDLTDLNLNSPPHLVGFIHYQRLFSSEAFLQFQHGIRASAIFVLVGVPARVALALLVAQLLNQKIPLLRLLRTAYYLPTVVAGVAAALLWLTMLDPTDGIVNEALRGLHVSNPPDWLGSGSWAMFIMIVYYCWYLGTAMVIFLAALQGVPTELYEAASIDGAGPIRRFINVSLPMISPVILFTVIIGLIGSIQEFVAPFVLTNGGPVDATRLLGLDLYQNAIVYTYPGHGAAASAEAMVLFMSALVLTVGVFFGSRRFVFYAGEREGGL